MDDATGAAAGLTAPGSEVPLALDLDGTVCRTDTLMETALALAARRPEALLAAMPALAGGRAALKHALAGALVPDPASLVYNDAVLALARAARAAGRPVYLVTAADRAVAEAVAAHLGLFDGVIASGPERNLKGEAKAAALVARFGERGFAYAGDAPADRAVWRRAAHAYLVSPPEWLRAAVAAECGATLTVIGAAPDRAARLRLLRRELRVHQWAKNALLFLPALGAHRLDGATLLAAALGFFAFSLCASSVYVLNDLLDLPHDRAHRTKRHRPFASGALPLTLAPGLLLATLGGGFAIALALPWRFLPMLAGYYAATLSYSFVLKRRVAFDVIMLAGLYTVRVFAGGAATGIPVSPWLLAFSMFLFFCLAIVKRLGEIAQHVRAGGTEAIAGRGYRPEDIDMLRGLASASGTMAVLVLALYVNSPEVRVLYAHPTALWLLCPLLLFWVSRMLIVANRGDMHDDPVVYALNDRASLATLAAAGLTVFGGSL